MKKTVLICILIGLVCLLPLVSLGEETGLRYEMEEGELLGGAKVLRLGDDAWVEGLSREGDGVTVAVEAPADGFYDLTVYQAGIGGYKENYLLLDGEAVGNTVAEGLSYAGHTLSHLWMEQGTHQVTVLSYWGNVRLDYLLLTPSQALAEDLYDVPPVLCNPAPSEEAQALMNWMCEIYGEKMISGQYLEEGMYGQELRAVAGVTGGLYPALVGLDMMNYSPASVSLGSWPQSVDQALGYWKQGYLLTFCWHWVAPEKYLDTRGNSWWGGFRTENTTFDLAKAMNGEDEEGYQLLLRDMDAIADQLARLRDAGVPVLWRPLHEASGGWFWWGASGPEAYISLYRLMYDRFTNLHGLNNLIWVWNGQDKAWYPGDDVVDIIGEDIYAGNHAHDSQSAAFLRCADYTKARKLIMMSECGCVPSPIKCQRDGTVWSAWCVWCYEFVQVNGVYNEAYTSADTLKMFYTQDNVVTLADVPAFGREKAEENGAADALTFSFADGAALGQAVLTGEGVSIRGNTEGDRAVLSFSVPESGEYRLSILQSGIGGYKENYLDIDGERLGNTVVQGEAEEECDFGEVHLEAGEHELTVTAFWGWVNLKSLTLTPVSAGGGVIRAEFEDGELLGSVTTVALGADIFVELASNDETDGVTVAFSVPEDGYYDLTIVQAGIGGYKENYLAVDGERIENTVVQGTAVENCVTEHVWLGAGEHTVTVTCFWGWARLDALIVSPAAE